MPSNHLPRPLTSLLALALVISLGGCAMFGSPESGAQQSAAAAAVRPEPEKPSFDIEVKAPEPARELLEKHLELQRFREVQDLDDAELTRLISLADRNARELLGTLGYFSPKLSITRQSSGERPLVVIEVELGKRTAVKDVDIAFEGVLEKTTEPDAVAQREGIRDGWGLPPGQNFTQDGWDDAKGKAVRRLGAKRFLGGRISYSLADIDAATNEARLGLRLDSGPIYYLGPLEVTGVERYDQRLVPRLARLAPGSEYDRDAIVQAQLRLTGSGYYDSAFINIDPDSDPAAAPVQVAVREAKMQKVVLGVGLTTDTGARLSVEHTHNRLPAIGWRASSLFQLDRKAPVLQSELTSIPGEDGWRWSVLGRLERVDDGDLRTQGQRLRVGKFKSQDHIDRNYYLQLDRARVSSISGVPLDAADVGSASALSANYIWTGRYFDGSPTPTGGYGIGIELGGGITLGADRTPFQRTLVRWLTVKPLASSRLQLRAQAGAVLAKKGAALPSTQLFRTGGDTTVRGYGYRDIGASLPVGETGPGRYLAVGSIEWQRPIRRGGVESDFDALLFLDAGAVADQLADLRPVYGIGTGVRWRSPIGPVEASVAYGVQPRKLRLHLTVGFKF
ncbi:MAG: BamA/TamA family outer membrane protein [Microbacteriaceae bacterium]|nr:BamA/TamA family outer membrane protein [Burkholderiaceae bacterium]